MSKRICFAVQRYGLEVNGGAELHCRQIAEHLHERYPDIDVVTTKAIDYISWKNEYTADEETINGIHVIRFGVEHERDMDRFNEINGRFLQGRMDGSEEGEWIDRQGPYSPALLNYLKEHHDDYDVFILVTYLYYPTVMGVNIVGDKAIVIPDAHDEPFLKMKSFSNVFLKPRALFVNTDEELKLIRQKYHNDDIPCAVGGAGVELPENVSGERFKQKYGLDSYVVYVGRIDEAKGCPELFHYFCEYKKRNPGPMKLVLMGKPIIEIPKNPDIVSLGFVSDEDKFDGIAGAQALLLPSKFESLSIVVLEAMYLRTPVIVNGTCEVLKGHCIKSNGAFYYRNFYEFEGELNYLLKNPETVSIMKDNALEYVNANYHWDRIIDRLSALIESI